MDTFLNEIEVSVSYYLHTRVISRFFDGVGHEMHLKVTFFQRVLFIFQISKSQKKIFEKTILSLIFKFPANNTLLLMAGNLNFKLRIAFRNIFF